MIWAACCLAFFGFLRVSEFTVPADNQYDDSCHLSLSSISIDSRVNPQQLKITIKQSKTDPFRKGVSVFLGATGKNLCPVRGILPYLAIRGNHLGPLFIFEDGRGLTRQRFSLALNGLLNQLQMNTQCYNTHSFRIGAATTARQANIPEILSHVAIFVFLLSHLFIQHFAILHAKVEEFLNFQKLCSLLVISIMNFYKNDNK